MMSLTTEPSRMDCKEAGFSEEVLERLNDHFAQLIKADKIQCASYVLARHGKVFADGAMGRLRFDRPESVMNKDSIRRIASVTKLFTAVAIFQLIEEGKLFLRQSVADWIEEFKHPLYESINIMHLLTHTSGLRADPFYYLEPYPAGWGSVLFAYQPERSEEHTSELQSRENLVCRLLLEKKKIRTVLATESRQVSYHGCGSRSGRRG